MDNEGGEDMEARHLREKNELQEKVAELKKSVQKADKKKKKEVNAEILRLEGDLNEKHSAEIMEQMLDNVSIEDENVEENTKEVVKVEQKQSIYFQFQNCCARYPLACTVKKSFGVIENYV